MTIEKDRIRKIEKTSENPMDTTHNILEDAQRTILEGHFDDVIIAKILAHIMVCEDCRNSFDNFLKDLKDEPITK